MGLLSQGSAGIVIIIIIYYYCFLWASTGADLVGANFVGRSMRRRMLSDVNYKIHSLRPKWGQVGPILGPYWDQSKAKLS